MGGVGAVCETFFGCPCFIFSAPATVGLDRCCAVFAMIMMSCMRSRACQTTTGHRVLRLLRNQSSAVATKSMNMYTEINDAMDIALASDVWFLRRVASTVFCRDRLFPCLFLYVSEPFAGVCVMWLVWCVVCLCCLDF